MPKKSLGQNFLNDDSLLLNIVKAGDILESDTILEIGPGTGNITRKILLQNPKKLIVIEKDTNLAVQLKKKFGKDIEIINKDILECYNLFNFKSPIKVFGNLPYNISTKILTSFVKIDNLKQKYNKFIFIFQKEVADRILAKENSKNYGRLSILTSWKMDRIKIIDINPKYFYPQPKVWSTLEHITNIFFRERRKMIRKTMKFLFDDFEGIAKKLDINLNLRPQNISKNKYLEICRIYENLS